ncbi:YozE family protein [Vagococcus acidifermentans]|uniref:UPF0346 protein CBF27_05220 n=1 Tax=Vagococcus acidifermentans TaxID=564710 RepID=A0A430AXY8_9ENTE|nr:YozE family protein [Vagococcus acidifermentans]RSU12940.1 hypothetical protein CBF27_05220 [Vagococcus acidifermentans]
MKRSFYHYVQTLKEFSVPNPEAQLAKAISDDSQFPKHSETYHDISDYLENNAYYITNMDLFDELWDKYLQNN